MNVSEINEQVEQGLFQMERDAKIESAIQFIDASIHISEMLDRKSSK